MSLVVLLLLVAAAVYGGGVWYPRRVAGQAMGPTSRDFARALPLYEATVAAFPTERDPDAITDGAAAVLEQVDQARETLSEAQVSLEGRPLPQLPVLSGRPPLSVAGQVRGDLVFFYTESLEVVADLESLARYLTELGPTLPRLRNLRNVLGDPRTPGEISRAVAAATPIVDQLIADLKALRFPEELGPVQASLLAMSQAIRRDLREIERVGREGRSPALTALIEDVRSRTRAYRRGFTGAPAQVMEVALDPKISAVDRASARILFGLRTLRDDYAVTGLTIPEA